MWQKLAPIQNLVFITILLVFTSILRFQNLRYSDYISDEPGTFLFRGIELNENMNVYDFVISQKKGPLQLIVGLVPSLIVGDYNNELAQRIPFSLFSVAATIAFYLFVAKVTKSSWAGFVAAALLSTQGLVSGFGRIAQYQSLNLFFSSLALFFYADFLFPNKKTARNIILGTIMFSLSILAHWDAVLVLPAIILMFAQFLKNKKVKLELKKEIIIKNLLVGGIILLPFMVPYIFNYIQNPDNQSYLSSRLGIREGIDMTENIFMFYLYNPFFTGLIYIVLGVFGALFFRKSYIFTVWLLLVLSYYAFLVPHAGTHIYNILIPLVALCGLGFSQLLKLFPRFTKFLPVTAVFYILFILYTQTHTLFVDHSAEYPWQQETIFSHTTPKYTHGQPLRHLLGFPLKRYWNEINEFVNEENLKNSEGLSYISNENKTISKFYMDSQYGENANMFLVGIKRPYSFANDYKFSQTRGKHTVHEISNEEGEKVVKIYIVRPK